MIGDIGRRWWTRIVIAVFAVLGAELCYRYRAVPPLLDDHDVVVPGVSRSEIGDFAGPQFKSLRTNYFDNLRYYSKFEYTNVPAESDSAAFVTHLSSILRARLNVDRESAELLAEQDSTFVDGLARHLTNALALCAGAPLERYLAGLDAPPSFAPPENYDTLAYACQRYLGTPAPGRDDVTSSRWRDAMARLHSAGDEFRDLSSRVTSVAINIEAGASELRSAEAEVADSVFIINHLSIEQHRRLLGQLSQGALVFTRPNYRIERALLANNIVIVRTRGGDSYPIVFRSAFDLRTRTWWMLGASRQCSPRMATTPHLVF